MDLFKRIGTDRHKFKVQFFLKSLACNVKLKGDIYVKIKRGDHKVTSQSKVPLGQDGTCDFGKQILTFQSLTLFFDPDKKAYQQKQGEFTVVIITKKGEKKILGSFEFDLAEYANSGKENIQVSKKFGEKIKVVLEFDVFIKCMGEASQTSKSVDKQPERKKQSSLSKFTSLFTGNKQSPPKEEKKVNQNLKQSIEYKNKNQRGDSEEQKNTKEASKGVKNEKNERQEKRTEKIQSTNISKRIENAGSQRKIVEKTRKKKNDSQDDQNDDTPEKQSKNLVSIRQKDKDNYTEAEYSERDIDKHERKHKLSSPAQQPIYFDQHIKKKPNEAQNQPQFRPNKMKRTENALNKQASQLLKKTQKNKTNEIEASSNMEEIQKMAKNIQQLKIRNNDLEKQNKELKALNQKVTEQKQALNKKLEQVTKNNRNNDFFQTQREPANIKVDDEKIRNLQKEKGELLVKIQKLQEKYKKDFQKYEEKVEQYEQQRNELEQASKAEMKRLKEQFSQQKDKYDKLMSKYEEKANEAKQFKQKENELKQRLAVAQNNLSELKLKIGDQLNEANQEGNKTVIDVLTFLSQ